MLDVAVREAKDQDRRRRDKDTLLLSSTEAVGLDRRNSVDRCRLGWIETLDVQGRNGSPRDTRDGPEDASQANLVPDRRRCALSHAVLVVPVGKNDHERPCLYGTPPRSIFTACPSWPGVNAGGFRTRGDAGFPNHSEGERRVLFVPIEIADRTSEHLLEDCPRRLFAVIRQYADAGDDEVLHESSIRARNL